MAKKRFWNSEKLLSISAILISVCTLGVFLYQTNLVRKQQYMAVFPYVTMSNYGTGTDNYKFVIENNGIGPAIVTSIEVTTDSGENYPDIVDYVRSRLTPIDSVYFFYANISPGRLIPEKGTIEVIGVSANNIKSGSALNKILNSEDKDIIIEYESVYGEKWVLKDDLGYPVKK